jgi:crossover junction endodeoxyribonuclease RuvC
MRVLGGDLGIRGGLTIVETDATGITTIVDSIDVPTLGSGPKERVAVHVLQEWLLRHGPLLAYLERAQAMPKQGASSGFKYGRAVGQIEATVALCNAAIEIVEPSKWKQHFRLPGKDKEAARQRAISTWPNAQHFFTRKKDHGRAESALIALYGLQYSRLHVGTPPPGAQPGSIDSNITQRELQNE